MNTSFRLKLILLFIALSTCIFPQAQDSARKRTWDLSVPSVDWNFNLNRYSTGGLGMCMQFYRSLDDPRKMYQTAEIGLDLLLGRYAKNAYFGGLSLAANYDYKFMSAGLASAMYNSGNKLLEPANTSFTPFIGLNVRFLSVNFGYEFYPFRSSTENMRLPQGYVVKVYFRPTALKLLLVAL